MGRRRAETATTTRNAGLNAAAGMLLPAVGFALEVAMLASFLFWGFRQPGPWNLLLGIGLPAVVVVAWGVFMAPKSARRLPPGPVAVASLALFLLAGLALIAAGATILGVIMMAATVLWFTASWVLQRR
jgi:hypothetical protein